MNGTDCLNNKYIMASVVLVAAMVITFGYFIFSTMREEFKTLSCRNAPCPCNAEQPSYGAEEELETVPPVPPHQGGLVSAIDPVREYDYRKTFDPFENPARRIPRHELPPVHFKRIIDIPTRGYPDNFTQFGTLVKEGDPNKNEQNQILRLFGRQEYPGSNKYEYYTMINSGLDQIKVPVHTRKRELYDGDPIFVRELEGKYTVNLHRFDEPKYYPDIIY